MVNPDAIDPSFRLGLFRVLGALRGSVAIIGNDKSEALIDHERRPVNWGTDCIGEVITS
jgi:hypothetical protein